MAQRDIPWEALLDQPFLAQAFGYSTPQEVAGICILLLFSTPAAEKPSVASPDPREWAQAADRRRFKVLAPAKIRKNHEASKSRAQRINRPPHPSPARSLSGGPGSIKEQRSRERKDKAGVQWGEMPPRTYNHTPLRTRCRASQRGRP